eukprot:299447-Chlamydomonas_euryale.AAC.5
MPIAPWHAGWSGDDGEDAKLPRASQSFRGMLLLAVDRQKARARGRGERQGREAAARGRGERQG